MNEHQVGGRVEEAKGKIKEVAGKTTGDRDLQARGTAQKAAGKMEKTYGDVKEDVKKDLKKDLDSD